MNLCEAIEGACRRFADRVALIEHREGGDRRVRYAELYELALAVRAAWHARGLRPDDRVAVLFDNSLALVATEWACLFGGGIWVALSPRWSPAECSAILADCRPKLLLAAARHRELAEAIDLPAGCRRVLVVEGREREILAGRQSPARERRLLRGDEAVRIRYTSGTAGFPKGAVITRANYEASVEAVTSVLGPIEAHDTVVQVAPMTHAAGAMLVPHLLAGARALLLQRFEPKSFIELVCRYRGTAVFLVPTMLVRLLDALEDPRSLESLRTIVYGGAPMPVDRLVAALERLGPVFVQIYGLTESSWPVTALAKSDHVRKPGESAQRWHARLASCGRPTEVGELRIVTADGRDARPGEVGEIWVRGRNTMKGYWGGAVDKAGKGLDAHGWMHTGDLGFRDAEGFVTIVDRLHDMIVTGGFNVYPREVEQALSSHPAVLECAVVGRPHPDWGEAVHGFVVLKPGAAAEPSELIEHVGRQLAAYKKPKAIEIVGALPKTASGKILRRVLRERLRGS